MSRPKPAAAVPVDAVPSDAEIVAMVAAGDMTATVDGEELEVLEIDLAAAPDVEPHAVEASASAAPVLVLGAPGTIAVQAEDGSWIAVLPGADA